VRSQVLVCVWIASLACPVRAQQPVTQAELLRRVVDVQRLTTPPPVGERTVLFSSQAADRSTAPDAKPAPARFLRHDEDGWDVMAEVNGPGAVTHIWSGSPQGDIRFVLDGEDVLTAPLADLLAGRIAPFEEPLVDRGVTCHFPIGFGRSCRVVCRNSSAPYEIDTVRFPPGTQVERFKSALDNDTQAALAEVKKTLQDGLSDKQLLGDRRAMPVAIQEEIGPNEVLSQTLEKTGTVRALYVALTDRQNPRDQYALHHCLLRIYVDGEKTPSVEAPLIDFFGSGFDLVPFNSLVLGTDKIFPVPLPERRAGEDRYMYCMFPMPFRNGLQIDIVNLNESKKKIGFLLHARVDTRPPAPDALRFYAGFRKEDPCQTPDHLVLDTTGRGRMLGCLLNIDCPRTEGWPTGGNRVWIDGEETPSHSGAGLADQISNAGGPPPYIGPLLGVTRSAPYGKTSAYHWQIANCIDFQKSIRYTIPNQSEGKPQDTYYSSVAYWYTEPGARRTFEPLTTADLTPHGLRIPGAVEIEGHVSGTDGISVVKQKYAGGAELSAQQAVLITTDQPVKTNIPSQVAQTVRLKLRTSPRRAFQTIAVTDAAGGSIGVVTYNRTDSGIYTVGVVHLSAGDNPVTVQCSQPALLDCWILEPLPDRP
jgi:hypothetical protein